MSEGMELDGVRLSVQSVRQQIAGRLRSDIFSGVLKRGEKLREQQLAERFGVSRAPIRDALMQLAQQGLVVSEANCGARVSDSPSDWMQPIIVKMRREIEICSITKAIGIITDQDVQFLQESVDVLGEACRKEDWASIMNQDIAFHERLLGFSREPDLMRIWLPIVTRMIFHYGRVVTTNHLHDEHVAIVGAIRARNLGEAITALESNIR